MVDLTKLGATPDEVREDLQEDVRYFAQEADSARRELTRLRADLAALLREPPGEVFRAAWTAYNNARYSRTPRYRWQWVDDALNAGFDVLRRRLGLTEGGTG